MTNDETQTRHGSRAGFTMVEVIIALLILTIGILGLAGTTGLVVRQVTGSKIATERTAALQSAIENVRAVGFADLTGTTTRTIGNYQVTWTVTDAGASKLVQITTTGPALEPTTGNMTAINPSATETYTYRMIRP